MTKLDVILAILFGVASASGLSYCFTDELINRCILENLPYGTLGPGAC